MKKFCFVIELLLILCLVGCGDHTAQADYTNGRTVLTLGGVYLDYVINSYRSDLRSIVNEFNKASDTCYIEPVDYGVELPEDAEMTDAIMQQSLTKLNTAVLSEDCPDLLCFQNNSPVSFIEKELLLDLDPLMEADEGFQGELLLGSDALHQYGGLYVLSPVFKVNTMMCSTETHAAHEDWTIEEYFEIERNLREDQTMLWEVTKEDYLRQYSSRYLAEALDYDNASCDFDNERFLQILRGAQSIQPRNEDDPDAEGYVPDAPIMVTAKRVAMGEVIACGSGYEPWLLAFDRTQGEGKIAYIGWPTPEGGGGSDLSLKLPIGVYAGTAHAEGCWEFLKYMMTHPVFEYSNEPAPMYAPMLEEVYRDDLENDGFVTQQDVDTFCAMANSCKTMSFTEEDVVDIILKEADVMFHKNATPEEVARRVQQSVSLYMMEQYG